MGVQKTCYIVPPTSLQKNKTRAEFTWLKNKLCPFVLWWNGHLCLYSGGLQCNKIMLMEEDKKENWILYVWEQAGHNGTKACLAGLYNLYYTFYRISCKALAETVTFLRGLDKLSIFYHVSLKKEEMLWKKLRKYKIRQIWKIKRIWSQPDAFIIAT